MTDRIFLLSPASCAGKRAQLLLRAEAAFDLAVRLRTGTVPIAEAFSFLSGLYFRGKAAYARAFGRSSAGAGAFVITPTRGLVALDFPVSIADLREFACVPIDVSEPRYREPLVSTAGKLAAQLNAAPHEVVLLGSVATAKYVDVLDGIFPTPLLFPREFVGRGDMSRGGLLLRAVDANVELEYIPVAGAVRHGPRPPRLEPRN